MKFDVVVGNPPYNGIKHDGTKWQSMYISFVELAESLAPIVIFITPAQWMTKQGCKGTIEEFKHSIINNKKLNFIKYYDKVHAASLFDWPMIIGGVCYFVLDKHKEDVVCHYVNSSSKISVLDAKKSYNKLGFIPLNDPDPDISLSVVNKLSNQTSIFMSDIFKRGMIGSKQIESMAAGSSLCYRSKGRTKMIDYDLTNEIGKRFAYKYANGVDIRSGFIDLKPNETVTESFMYFCLSDNELVESLNSYLGSSLILFMRTLIVNSHNNTKKTWTSIPRVSFTHVWTDQKLYEYFNLTQGEIDHIEDTVK